VTKLNKPKSPRLQITSILCLLTFLCLSNPSLLPFKPTSFLLNHLMIDTGQQVFSSVNLCKKLNHRESKGDFNIKEEAKSDLSQNRSGRRRNEKVSRKKAGGEMKI